MMKAIAVAAVASMLLAGCDKTPPTKKDVQAQEAARRANNLQFTGNAEIDNIERRLNLTSKPGAVGFILLLNEAGQPIMYTSVKGKITSSSKRLTPPVKFWSTYEAGVVADAPSDEGTWGSSDPYIYFWTQNGQYIQWSGKYLYSDQPIRTRVEPLIIDVKGA